MNVLSTKRAAAFGMAGALALGTVVSTGVLAPADAADSAPTVYNCQVPAALGGAVIPSAVVGSFTAPASAVESGSSLAALPVTMNVTLVDQVIHAIAGQLFFSKLGGTVTNGAFTLASTTGNGTLPLGTLSIPQTDVPAAGQNMVLAATGATAPGARAPLPGDYTIGMPSSFTFDPVSNSPVQTGPLPCTLSGTAGTLGTLSVVKATSRTTAKLANAPALTSKRPKILAKVTAAGYAATGKVIAKMGTKTLATGTLSGGKKVLVLPKLSKGKHTIKVIYKATQANKASSAAVTFTTKRG